MITGPDFDLCVGASSRDVRAQAGVTLAGVSARTAPLGRLSPLRDWLAHPATRERLQPVVSALQRRLFGTEVDLPPAGAEGGDITVTFMPDVPIAKLVMFGVLSEQDLAKLLEVANTRDSRQ